MAITSDIQTIRRPRIGIDCHVLTGKAQGSATFLLNMLREMARLDCPFETVLYCHDKHAAQQLIGPSPFVYIELRPMGSLRRLLLSYPRQLRRDKIDLAIFQFVTPPLSTVPALVIVHDLLPFSHPHLFPPFFRWSRQRLFSLSIARARAIATVSEFSRGEIVRLFPDKSERVCVIVNGPTFSVENAEMASPVVGAYILAVGRIEKRKKIDLLVKAFIAANLEDVSLVIVGSADMGYKLSLPEDSRIVYLQNVPTPVLASIYKRARLFVFPSEAEGFGIPVLDALLAGVPVIASNQTAIPEVAMGLARLFDPTRPDVEWQLASLLRGHFSDDPVPAPSIAQREQLAQTYSWHESARKLVSLIARLTQRVSA